MFAAVHPNTLLRSHWTSQRNGGAFLILLVLITSPMGLLSLVRDYGRRPAANRITSQHGISGNAEIPIGQSAENSNPVAQTRAIDWHRAACGYLCGNEWTGHAISIAATILTSLVIWRVGLAMFAPPIGWLSAWLVSLTPMAALESGRAASSLAWTFMAMAFSAAWCGMRSISPARSGGQAAQGLRLAPHRVRMVAFLVTAGIFVLLAVVATPAVCDREGPGSDRPALSKMLGVFTAVHVPLPPLLQTLLLPVLLWPVSLGLGPGLVLAFRRSLPRIRRKTGAANHHSDDETSSSQRRAFGRRAYSFCLIWIIAGWLLAELFSHRVPNGSALVYPPLALLCVRGVYSLRRAWEPVVRSAIGRFTIVGSMFLSEALAVGVPLSVAFMGRMKLIAASVVATTGLLLLVQVLLWFAALALRRRDFPKALLILSFCAALTNVVLFGLVVPRLEAGI
jgi:hypothetical protein